MYFLALVLPPDLNEKIHYWKKYMFDKHLCKVGLKSPAHITVIAPFWMEENLEDQLIIDVDKLSADLQPLTIATNNFSAFKPRTIFAAVKENKELEELKIKTDEFFKQSGQYQMTFENRPFHPHITIATRDLFKRSFYEAWPVFEKEILQEEWEATGLSVLKHNKKTWEVIYTSRFGAQPDAL